MSPLNTIEIQVWYDVLTNAKIRSYCMMSNIQIGIFICSFVCQLNRVITTYQPRHLPAALCIYPLLN